MKLYSQEIVKKGKKRLHEDIIAIELMEHFKWSWEDYINTPERIVNLIFAKMEIDSKLRK